MTVGRDYGKERLVATGGPVCLFYPGTVALV